MQEHHDDKPHACVREQDPVFSRLWSRAELRARWKKDVRDSFFYRAQLDGRLPARRRGRTVGYAEQDVFAFEGGPPPEGLEEAYRAALMRPEDVAALCPYQSDTIIAKARAGELPCRRIGRDYRFVSAEVARWLEGWS
ncbi:helix-turn-helix domain-containing protein [Rhodovulum sp. YNF3179]|uniref:helix-turn-helix domain-containing protein n=1 Tax=Rhodovulum sp. YNF3179 TaxID=3425127 RepID=UPI003D33DCB3